MKKIITHPPEAPVGKRYWRSLDEYSHTDEFKEWLSREFPQGAAEFTGDDVSRRNFIKLMGASVALAGIGLSGCRRPRTEIIPFTKTPEFQIPGKPLSYATSIPRRNGALPLLVTTYDGRPTKAEGNYTFPGLNGSTDQIAQASVLSVYDPDRSKGFVLDGKVITEDAFNIFLEDFKKRFSQGNGLAILLDESNSPTRARLIAQLASLWPKAIIYSYDPVTFGRNKEKADAIAYGANQSSVPLYDNAKIIVSLDFDFLGFVDGTPTSVSRYSKSRRITSPEDSMSRLYAVEHRYTLAGGMADHRLRLPSSQIPAFTALLATELTKQGLNVGANCDQFAQFAQPDDFKQKWIQELAADLINHKGQSLVVAGPNQPVETHLMVAAINSALGALGKTLVTRKNETPSYSSIVDLANAIKSNSIQSLLILGGNPVYNAPADLGWSNLQRQVAETIHLSFDFNETSKLSKLHIPAATYLESWGDALAEDGTYLNIQPLILPLFDGLSQIQLVERLLGLPGLVAPDAVKETFKQIAKPSDFETAWNRFIHSGFLENSTAKTSGSSAQLNAINQSLAKPGVSFVALGSQDLELVIEADYSVEDGSWANNGWLQELPDPITKITWGNAALVSANTAKALGLKSYTKKGIDYGEFLRISVGGNDVQIPIQIAPGHADNSISLFLGYGRKLAGRVGGVESHQVGFDVYPLRTTNAASIILQPAIQKMGGVFGHAITQQHWAMEGRALFRENTIEGFKEDPLSAKKMGVDAHVPPNISIYQSPPLTAKQQWAMTIDLNSCVGCNACMIACQAENNIPIVGAEQVKNGREMHWIRIDRYFAGPQGSEEQNDIENPEMVMQPVACLHCENAPCEVVCPVNATVHSEDGLNVMAYNRCIGTRYCANNCPYKVRRFNFFDYNKRPIQDHQLYLGPMATKSEQDTELYKFQQNPNVTVRMRGVMEKCTYCVQRIEEAKIDQLIKAKDSSPAIIPDGSLKSACQQVCPAEAITFGDMNDESSNVSRNLKDPRSYALLSYLNTRPRTSHMMRLRNPNPKMPDAAKVGLISIEKNDSDHDDHTLNPELPAGEQKHEAASPAHGQSKSH
ncbi:MAG: TAT-variant-translocated molybdopterin oxidoreductase [Verrucomicrobiota bacterium]|nr:TAT-variant-translocated molybdopterin oxidoreductase [Verrucomicrobiota bacterium]